MITKTKGLILAAFLSMGTSVAAESVVISIGEQPPLFTKEGGIVDRVVREALAREGYLVRFDWLPMGRMLDSLNKDSLGLYVTASNTPGQQNPKVNFFGARGVFFFRKSRVGNPTVTRLEDLAGKRVGTFTNSPLRTGFEKAGIEVDEGPYETLFLKLEAGRDDFTAMVDVGGLLMIQQLFPGREQEFDFTDYSYMELTVGLYQKVGSGNDRVLAAFQRGLQKLKKEGTLSRYLQEFFGPTYAKRVKIF